jgi:hypothetical protein
MASNNIQHKSCKPNKKYLLLDDDITATWLPLLFRQENNSILTWR